MGWGALNTSGTVYGTASGVQRYITAFNFTSTSEPSASAVEIELDTQSAIMDGRLYKAGFSMPITDADALVVLGRICDLYVAADMWERIVLGREPTMPKVETAEVWRKKAEDLFTLVLEGSMALGDDLYATSKAAAVLPGVSNATAITSSGALDTFVETYGASFYLDESQDD